jgi:hypothetical protein
MTIDDVGRTPHFASTFFATAAIACFTYSVLATSIRLRRLERE